MPYVILDESGQYLWGARGGWIRIDALLPPAYFQLIQDAQAQACEVKRLTGQDARPEVISAVRKRR